MKLYVDTQGKQVTVSKATETKNDQNGNQRSEKGTGRLMWSTQVFVLDETGGEVISITTAGEKPNVTVGQLVTVEQLEPSRGRPTGATAWRSERCRSSRWLVLRPASRSSQHCCCVSHGVRDAHPRSGQRPLTHHERQKARATHLRVSPAW